MRRAEREAGWQFDIIALAYTVGSLVFFSISKLYIWGMELKFETIQLEPAQGNESQQLGWRQSLSPSIHRVLASIHISAAGDFV